MLMQKIGTVLLSILLVIFSAYQVRGAELEKTESGIVVRPDTASGVVSGEKIDGEIKMTAALSAFAHNDSIPVEFVLQNNRYTYRSEAVVTEDSVTEEGLFAASASFSHLPSGVYTVRIEVGEEASLSYMLAEKGDESKYTMEESLMTFYLTEETPTGSAWFMLEESGREEGAT